MTTADGSRAACHECKKVVATRVDLVSLVFAKHYHRGEVCVGSGRRVAYRTEEEIAGAQVTGRTPLSTAEPPHSDFRSTYGTLADYAATCRTIGEWLRDERAG